MKLLITGSRGMVGSHLVEAAQTHHDLNLLLPTSAELDLRQQAAVETYLAKHRPDMIVHLAAVVGGIQANINEPVRFLCDNSLMGIHLIQTAAKLGVPRLINLGSSCMYPKEHSGTLHESDLLTGALEPTNEGYALAKLMASRLCDAVSRTTERQYKTLIPCNLYGKYDNFDPATSHMVPAIIHKTHQALRQNLPTVSIWGDGSARREFMYAGDLADLILYCIENFAKMPQTMNAGLGSDYSVTQYYQAVAKLMGYQGDFSYELNRPVGMKRKCVDVSKLHQFGWQAPSSLDKGLKLTVDYYLNEVVEHEVSA